MSKLEEYIDITAQVPLLQCGSWKAKRTEPNILEVNSLLNIYTS